MMAILVIFSVVPAALAHDHYSYELAEQLKPLIEWRDYGPEAFEEAAREHMPIFLLLTAPSWCYWCQVYESEEYLFDEQVYTYINENFIPIYVDADRRQDLTRQYLEGGWPSTTVLAPNGERLFGFSGPRPVHTMLASLSRSVDFVSRSGFANVEYTHYGREQPVVPSSRQLSLLEGRYLSLTRSVFDATYGGFGTGQKFPQYLTLDFLLDRYEESGDPSLLEIIRTTFDGEYTELREIKTDYNLFDPVEGGFHRYGTTRHYTPPHYEKMLYDNVKALQAYVHLLTIDDDPRVREAVEKTLGFVRRDLYDAERGGFHGNVDAFEEDEYYGKVLRPTEKPRIETTKYTDWNALAVISYLEIADRLDDPTLAEMATRTLDLFAREMVTDRGAYHFMAPDGERGITGNIIDNAFLTYALVKGYEKTGERPYLEAARRLADYSLDNLYDWYGGGFFERNSAEEERYAPQELVILEKPIDENGVMALAMAELFTATGETRYLAASVKTIGRFVGETPYLDAGYHLVSAARYVREHGLLDEYRRREQEIATIDAEEQASTWLTRFMGESVTASDFELVEGAAVGVGNYGLLLLIVLLAGILSVLSPCTLPVLPAYLASVFSAGKRFSVGMAISFFLGLSSVFALMGMTVSSLGAFFRENIVVLERAAGTVIIAFGILVLFGKGFGGMTAKKRYPVSYGGTFALGGLLAVSWTPCVGPVLASVLLLASTASGWKTGGFLLFIYAVGLALPLIALSWAVVRLDRKSRFWRLIGGREWVLKIGARRIGIHSSSAIAAVLLMVLGVLMISGSLTSFNRVVGVTDLQKMFAVIEENLLYFIK